MRGLRAIRPDTIPPARWFRCPRRRSDILVRYFGRDSATLTPGRWLVVSFDRATGAFWERSRRSRRYGQYAAWHKSCFGSIMLVILVVLLSIFGAGFGAGYGVREAISRRRRREYRRSMA